MTTEADSNKMDKIYEAVRKTYGYGDDGDELVDFLFDLMEDHERVGKGA